MLLLVTNRKKKRFRLRLFKKDVLPKPCIVHLLKLIKISLIVYKFVNKTVKSNIGKNLRKN